MAEAWPTIIGFCIGIGAYAALYIGKGFHKLGIDRLKVKVTSGSRLKQSGTWMVGTALMVVYMLAQWAALLLVPVNMIAPLEGPGLVILLAFSRRVLGEPLTRPGIAGAALVVAGTVLCAVFYPWGGTTGLVVPDLDVLLLVTLAVPAGGSIAVAIALRARPRVAGAAAGFVAGILIALETVSKRLSSAHDPAAMATFSTLAIVYSVASLAMNQVGYANGTANVVVPCSTATSVIFATALGFWLLGEVAGPMQVVGIALIIPGILLLTMRPASRSVEPRDGGASPTGEHYPQTT